MPSKIAAAEPVAAEPGESSAPLPEVASRLRLAVMRLSRRLRQHAPVGITPVATLGARHHRASRSASRCRGLAEAERVQPPSITRVVDVLVSEGFATRTPERRGSPRRVGRADRRGPRARRNRSPSARCVSRAASAHVLRRRPRCARAGRGVARTAHRGPTMTRVRRLGRDTFLVAAQPQLPPVLHRADHLGERHAGCSSSRRRG